MAFIILFDLGGCLEIVSRAPR